MKKKLRRNRARIRIAEDQTPTSNMTLRHEPFSTDNTTATTGIEFKVMPNMMDKNKFSVTGRVDMSHLRAMAPSDK